MCQVASKAFLVCCMECGCLFYCKGAPANLAVVPSYAEGLIVQGLLEVN